MKNVKIGDTFGDITVIESLDGLAVNGNEWVKCRCSCGEVFYSKKSSLSNGTVTMCALCKMKNQYKRQRVQPTCEYCGRTISRGKFCSDRCLFLTLMIETDTDCIEFKSDSATIFPTFKGEFAYIVEWEYLHGAIPTGYRLIHTCGNPRCVNPQHMKLVKLDNVEHIKPKSAYKNIDTSIKRYKTMSNLGNCNTDFVMSHFINDQGRFMFDEFREYFGFAISTAWNVKKRLGLTRYPNYYVRASTAQSNLFDWLPVSNKTLNDRSVIPPLELDIYLENNKIAIEYDGVYWHNDTDKNLKKFEELNKLGIRFFDIFEFEDTIIWKSVLLRSLRLLEYKVTAMLKEIEPDIALDFIKHHSFENVKGDKYFGLYANDSLLGVISKDNNKLKIILGTGVEIDNLEVILYQHFNNFVLVLNNRFERPEDYIHNYIIEEIQPSQDWFIYSRKIYTYTDIKKVITHSSKYVPERTDEENFKNCKVNHIKDLGQTLIKIISPETQTPATPR